MHMNKPQKTELVPALRFPEFQNAGGWEVKTFDKLFTIGNGKDYKHLSSGDIPVYGSGGYMLSVDNYLYDGESVCIGRKGTIDKPMFLSGKFWTVDTLFYTHSFKNCLPRFVYAIFQNINWATHNEAGGVPSLSKANIGKIEVSVPTVDEQQKIADCLASIDDLITAETQKIAALKTHKKGLMQQLFPAEGETVPRLRFPEFRDAGAWIIRELGEFMTERVEYPTESIPLFSLTIENGVTPKTERYERSFLVNNEKDAYKLVFPDDFAFNPMNLRFGAIGRHSGQRSVAVSKYYNIFYCDKSVDSRFCEIYFKSDGMIAFYDNMATGSLIEKRRVHFSDFLHFNIRFPHLKEQQKIADCLSSIDELIAAQGEKVDALKLHKKGLMQQLFPVMEDVAA